MNITYVIIPTEFDYSVSIRTGLNKMCNYCRNMKPKKNSLTVHSLFSVIFPWNWGGTALNRNGDFFYIPCYLCKRAGEIFFAGIIFAWNRGELNFIKRKMLKSNYLRHVYVYYNW